MASEADEIWSLYQDDGGDSLRAAEDSLQALDASREDRPAIAALFRALHTFKGNSRLLGLTHIERLAHLAEDLVGLVRDSGVAYDKEIGAALLETVDALRGAMEEAVVRRTDVLEDFSTGIAERLQTIYAARNAELAGSAIQGSEDAEVVYFEPAERPLAEDPLYLQFFLELATDALAKIECLDADAEAAIATLRSGSGCWIGATQPFAGSPARSRRNGRGRAPL